MILRRFFYGHTLSTDSDSGVQAYVHYHRLLVKLTRHAGPFNGYEKKKLTTQQD